MNKNTDNSIVDPRLPYTHSRLLCDIEKLCDRYPELICISAVGISEKLREIPVLRIGRGDKRVLAAGGIHGREYVTVGFLLRCIEEYAHAYMSGELYEGYDLQKVFREFTLYLVPSCNPDSVEIALGRDLPQNPPRDFQSVTYKNNVNNVNLNANFPYIWECVPKERQGGKNAASERETKLLIELCEQENFEKMLSFHARGDCLYWRDSGSGEIYGDTDLAEALAKKCGYTLCPPTERAEDYSGGFENWFRHRFRRCAICVELITDENADFYECCRDFDRLTRWEQTRSTILEAMTVAL